MYHRLNRGSLVDPTERHQDCVGSDCRVKPLGQASFRAHIEVGDEILHALLKVPRNLLIVSASTLDNSVSLLLGAVSIEELTRNIHKLLASERHREVCLLSHPCNLCRLEVLTLCQLFELLSILSSNDYSHSLLRLADSELRAVQPIVLLRNVVKIYIQSVCQFSDSDGYTACAEVIAALYEGSRFRISEQSLNLSLLGSVALLHLGSARLQRLQAVRFGRAGRSADSVSAGSAA